MNDKKYKVINKIIIVFSKIFEVCCWIGSAAILAMTIFLAVGKPMLIGLISDIDVNTTNIELFGAKIESAQGFVESAYPAFIVFFISGIVVCACMAKVFRNVNLIFKTTMGKTKFSEGPTPFQKVNVRMIREIGILLVALPIVQLIFAAISSAISHGAVSADANLSFILVGLVVLALSQFFAYGVKLQQDVDGLV